ncbi:hypothetical protein [Eubacterium xylanophilum]|uniref:hypothetical protein n=1 Tax=Eubacterium xylanophilum TaxID=39497 RepID=UPI0004AFE9C4|nr:hypothetical protein [Eubacterium xylanophilum]
MERVWKRIIAGFMAMLILSITPLADFAPRKIGSSQEVTAAKKTPNYLSEVKIGMGDTEREAKKELEEQGYIILRDESGNYADLNTEAGTKSVLKRGATEKIVYLGYKITNKATEAITDLAVMNMNGGYSIEEYNMLMEQQMDSQIKPFVDRFIATLEEYRANYKKSKKSKNYKRANHVRMLLNKLTDDDTGGQPIGDLLLNKTKYELGDKAYNALSDKEKKNHADILTLLMQANGNATISIETLLSKATDSSNDTWIDRMKETSLEDLKDKVKEENPKLTTRADVMQAMDKKYYDTAAGLLKKWNSFHKNIESYEDYADDMEDSVEETTEMVENIENMGDTLDEEKIEEIADASAETTKQMNQMQVVGICTYLNTVKYDDGTLLDFFSQDYKEVSGTSNIRKLYPMVEALTAGQIAGLDFLAIEDLIAIALTDENTYKDVLETAEDLKTASVYEGVDREIYTKGGVALTSDTLRAKAAASQKEPDDYKPGTLQIILWAATGACAIATVTTVIVREAMLKVIPKCVRSYSSIWNNMDKLISARKAAFLKYTDTPLANGGQSWYTKYTYIDDRVKEMQNAQKTGANVSVNTPSNFTKYLSAGLAVVTFILTVVSTVMTILDAQAYYDTEYIPIPKFMVDMADITTKDDKGDTIVIKNQTAYYRAVKCNRTEGDSSITKKNFKAMGDTADLKGDIGREWLALYAVKYEKGTPILADSLLYKKNDKNLPSGYTIGIHEFGSDAACDLNKKAYIFADNAPSIKVFFKTEQKTVKQLTGAGSVFSAGSVALGGGIGFIIGGLFVGLMMRRKKYQTED